MTMPKGPSEKTKSVDEDFERLREHPLWNLVVGILIFAVAIYLVSFSVSLMSGSADTALKVSEIVRNYALIAGGFATGTVGLYLAWRRVTAANRQAEASLEQARAALQQSSAANRQAKTAAESALSVTKNTAVQIALLKDAQFNEVFSKSVEQLGSKELTTKLGGIYALERIAQESKELHPQIMEILASYVRAECPWPLPDGTPEPVPTPTPKRSDIQSIIDVITRRRTEHDSQARINLQSSNLSGCDVSERKWINVDFSFSNFDYLNFMYAQLTDCSFYDSHLTHVSFISCKLMSVGFWRSDLTDSDFRDSEVTKCDFDKCNLQNTVFKGCTGIAKQDLKSAENVDSASFS